MPQKSFKIYRMYQKHMSSLKPAMAVKFTLHILIMLGGDFYVTTSPTIPSVPEKQKLRTLPTHRPTRKLPETQEELESALKKWKVIPDVLSETPEHALKVEYIYCKARYGNKLPPFLVTKEPVWLNWTIDIGCLYTLIMIDPDMPKPRVPNERDFRHWIVGNIPGTHVHKGFIVSNYVGGALALLGQGTHRYVFLVFKQLNPVPIKFPKYCSIIRDEESQIPEDVQHAMIMNHTRFNTKEFVERYNLGKPVAANYFRIAWGRG